MAFIALAALGLLTLLSFLRSGPGIYTHGKPAVLFQRYSLKGTSLGEHGWWWWGGCTLPAQHSARLARKLHDGAHDVPFRALQCLDRLPS